MKAMLVLVPIAATAKEMVMRIMIKVMLTIVMVLMISFLTKSLFLSYSQQFTRATKTSVVSL